MLSRDQPAGLSQSSMNSKNTKLSLRGVELPLFPLWSHKRYILNFPYHPYSGNNNRLDVQHTRFGIETHGYSILSGPKNHYLYGLAQKSAIPTDSCVIPVGELRAQIYNSCNVGKSQQFVETLSLAE